MAPSFTGLNDEQARLAYLISTAAAAWVESHTDRDGRARLLGRLGEGWSGAEFYSRSWISLGPGVSAGLTLEKDAGELSGADFAAGNLEVTSGAISNTRLVIGDFGLTCGQGLLLWTTGRRFVGEAVFRQAKARPAGLRANLSKYENGPLRGVAVEKRIRGAKLCVFGSQAHLDARADETGRISSLDEAGYHVTDSEKLNKDRLREDVLGVQVLYMPRAGSSVELVSLRSRYEPGFSGQTSVSMVGGTA